MDFIEQIKQDHAANEQAYDDSCKALQDQINASQAKIDWHHRRIGRLNKKKESIERPHWHEGLVRPVITEVARRTPDIEWEIKDRLLNFGLRCECPVFGKTKDGHTVGITFTPGDSFLYYDTGTKSNRFEDNTLGAVNKMNNISKPVDSIEELIALVRKQEREAITFYRNKKRESNENEP